MVVVTPDIVALKGPGLSIGERAKTLPALVVGAARRRLLFLAVVVLPTVAASSYFGLIATDVYISESRFILRSAQRPAREGGLNALLQSTGLPGFQRSVEDAYAVQDFMLSRDALRQLDTALGL